MTDTEKFLAEIKARAQDGRTECCVCLSPVIHHAADEGTQSYERVVSRTDIQRLVAMVEALERQRDKYFAMAELSDRERQFYRDGDDAELDRLAAGGGE